MTTDLFGHRSLADTGDRSAFDFYPTPAPFTRSLVYYVPEIAGSFVLECASGDDAITEVLRDEFVCTVVTNDLDPGHPAQMKFDAAAKESWPFFALAAAMHDGQRQAFDWIISNLPFNVAFPIVQHAVEHARVGVAFLLRKTFLEPTEERGEWLSKHPPSRIIGLPRHNFRGEGVDSVPCDWMIWERHPNKAAYPIEIDYLAKERGKGSV